MVGGIFTLFQHYVKFKRKDHSQVGFYEVCPDFDWATGEFRRGPAATCPLCADFSDQDLPRDLQMFGGFRYYFDAFDITGAMAGNTEGVYGVVWSNKYGKNDLSNIADILGHDVDDDENGYSFHWLHDENASDAKDRTRFHQGRRIPVVYDESKGVYVLSGGGKRFIGEPTDFATVVQVKSGEEITADLKRLGLYAKLSEVVEVQSVAREPVGPAVRVEEDANARGGWGDTPPAPTPVRPVAAASGGWGDTPVETPPSAPVSDGWGETPATAAPAAPVDDGWGSPPPAAAPVDDGWGTSPAKAPVTPAAPAVAADDGWGSPPPAAAPVDDGWETPKSSPAVSVKPTGDNGASFDNSFFPTDESADDGWGSPPSAPKSKGAPPAAENDPDAW